MKFTQLIKTPTAEDLNNRVAQMFGSKISLQSFTTEQLSTARDKLANQLLTIENQTNFDAIHSSEAYQKNRLFLKVIEQKIAELQITPSDDAAAEETVLDNTVQTAQTAQPTSTTVTQSEDTVDENMTRQHFQYVADMLKNIEDVTKRGEYAQHHSAIFQHFNPNFDHEKFMQAAGVYTVTKGKEDNKSAESVAEAKPDFLDLDKDGDKKEPMKSAAADKDSKSDAKKDSLGLTDKQKKLPAGLQKAIQAKQKKTVKESAEDTAKIVMAANSMVDKITSWLEDTAKMQIEVNLDLGDEIRNEMGSEKAEEFIAAMKPSIEQLYSQLENTRKSFTGGVAVLTGEEAPATLGADAPTDDIEDLEAEVAPEVTPDTADDFTASEPATGGEEPADRKKRESIIRRSPRLAEMLSRPFTGKKKV